MLPETLAQEHVSLRAQSTQSTGIGRGEVLHAADTTEAAVRSRLIKGWPLYCGRSVTVTSASLPASSTTLMSAGQIHDLACAQDLIENADPGALIADKAYDADLLINSLTEREISPVIPSKSNRKTKRDCDFALYCERNLIERFFNKIKHFRAIATRYDKLARNFLAAVQLVSAIILLNWGQALVRVALRHDAPIPSWLKRTGRKIAAQL
jgi:transposase